MRDLKFRVWDKTAKNMFVFDEVRICHEYNLLGFHWQGNHDIHDLELDEDNMEIMQFTGLKDKNGKDIYEGDIVHNVSQWDNANMFIIFECGQFRQVLCEKYKTYETGGGYYDINNFTKEIIGNIHQNPELIKP